MNQQQAQTSEADFSRLFETFVDNASSEVLGYVAYGLYKKAKREWVIEFRVRQGRAPNAEELDDYTRTWTPAKLRTCGQNAEQIVTRLPIQLSKRRVRRSWRML